MPLVVAAVALVALLVLVWLRMDVVQRLQFVALTCACFEIAGLIVLVIEARDEDRGAVLDRWGR